MAFDRKYTTDSDDSFSGDSLQGALTVEFMKNFINAQSAVYAFVRTLIPHAEQAKEVFQEVSLVLWKKYTEYDPSREFRSWALGVARKEVLKHRHKMVRDRHLFDYETMLKIAKSEDAYRDYLDMRVEILRECMGKLKLADQQILSHMETPDTSIRATASKLNMSESTLYKTFTRIRKQLLECIQRTLRMEAQDE